MRTATLASLLACLSGTAHASAVVIWPVDPVIKPGEQATALWLENKGDAPVTLQVRSLAWTQTDGEDQLAGQNDVVASPPIAEVQPGARQLVRIVRRTVAGRPETAYRLLIDELPRPAPDGAAVPQARLAVQMRYSIPLFVHATPATAPRLDARIVAGANGRVLLIRNDGGTHARLTDLRLLAGGGETVLRPGLAGYVLAGATLSLPLPGDQVGTVKVGVNGVDQVLGSAV